MKKNLLTVLILALLIVNIALNAVMMISMMGTNKKTAELVTNIATVMNLELTSPEEGEKTISMADTQMFSIPSMTIPLKPAQEGEHTAYIMFEAAFSMDKTDDEFVDLSAMEDQVTIIKGIITDVVNVHTLAECRENLDALKQEILEAVQDAYGDYIYKVSLSEVKFG
ncbi:MAG: hypothetical protein K6F84_07290 [Lachnospiraceae bacterium]|nr:hypothetical protein [Lachnospiraceae bacterium]